MENRIGFFEQFYVALVKHKNYKNLVQLSGRKHAAYVVGITLLLTLITFVIPMVSFVASLGSYETFFLKKLPAFSVENGRLEIERPLDFNLNGIHVIADDSIECYTKDTFADVQETVVYFSKTNAVTNLAMLPVMFSYEDVSDVRIDNAYMAGLVYEFYGTLIMTGIASWISQILGYVGIAFLFALFGRSVNVVSGANLTFGKLYCLSLYAISVFMLGSSLVNYASSSAVVLIGGLVAAGVSVRALHVGILSCVKKNQEL